MIRPYLTCGPDGTCCMNDPRGGNGCWDNLTGAMQIAWQTFHIGQVTGTPQFQFCARGGAHPLCPQIAGKLQFHQQIMSKLMGGP